MYKWFKVRNIYPPSTHENNLKINVKPFWNDNNQNEIIGNMQDINSGIWQSML